MAPETYALDMLGIGFSATSLATPVPGVGLALSAGYLGGQAAAEGVTGGEVSTFYDDLNTYWRPRNPAEAGLFAVSPPALAVWNAVEEGFAETEQQRAGS
ncbi:MAG: hypothetical protein ACRDTC_23940 [Pseudonocardiaceae bacterium]